MIVSWLTTNECNLKCRHCYQDAGSRKTEELTTLEAEKMIGEIAEAGFKIIVLAWNQAEVNDIIDFSVNAGAVANYIFFLIPVGRGKFLEDTSLQVMEYEDLLKTIMEKQKKVPIDIKPTCAPQFVRVAKELGIKSRFKKGCLAGLSYCVITPEGLVRPCAYMTEIAGNVREEPFNKIWFGSSVFEKLITILIMTVIFFLSGCRGRTASVAENKTESQTGYYQFTDALGQEIRVKNPQRVVALMGSFADTCKKQGESYVYHLSGSR